MAVLKVGSVGKVPCTLLSDTHIYLPNKYIYESLNKVYYVDIQR